LISSRSRALSEQFIVEAEAAKAMSAADECALLSEAVRRNPDSTILRLRLAKLLNIMDAFDRTIGLLTEAGTERLDFGSLLVLSHALLARGIGPDTRVAWHHSQRAFELATSDAERSFALAESAKAALRLEDASTAVLFLEQALQLDPQNSGACKRLATHWLGIGAAEEVLALTDRLAAAGVGHSRLLGSRMLALARVGRIEEARNLLNLGEFLHRQVLPAPAAWPDSDSFNAALAAEFSDHAGQRMGRHGTASRETVRIDGPATGAVPATRALLSAIATAAQQHVAGLKGSTHPWLAARPGRAVLASWCVITESSGFEDWHTHPQGWISGVYYADVPAAVCEGGGDAGCLLLGLPESLVSEDAARRVGTELVRPRPGLLAMFPSHAYHRTFPHGAPGRRICISFDLRPC
jgi:tetratricopeptide (TPR) repeat protein